MCSRPVGTYLHITNPLKVVLVHCAEKQVLSCQWHSLLNQEYVTKPQHMCLILVDMLLPWTHASIGQTLWCSVKMLPNLSLCTFVRSVLVSKDKSVAIKTQHVCCSANSAFKQNQDWIGPQLKVYPTKSLGLQLTANQ